MTFTLASIRNAAQKITTGDFDIRLRLKPHLLSDGLIRDLYFLLNALHEKYFITFEGIPRCLMPDAQEHLSFPGRTHPGYAQDKICRNCDRRKDCPGWNPRIPLPRAQGKPLQAIPHEIIFEVTHRCNHHCRTCAVAGYGNAQLPRSTVLRMIKESAALGIPTIRFTGGEPLLHPDITDLLQAGKDSGRFVLLNTNGTLLTPRLVKSVRMHVDNVLVSIQGYSRESDRNITGSDFDFRKKIRNIAALRDNVAILRVGTVLSRELLNNFEEYCALISGLKADAWEIYRPLQAPVEGNNVGTAQDLRELMRLLAMARDRGMKVKIANPVPFCLEGIRHPRLDTLLGALADDGHTRMVMDARGFFKPSYFLPVNLGKEIRQAWHHPFLKKIRSCDFLPKKCQACRWYHWCRGGSRAAALFTGHSCFLPDPLFNQRTG